MFLLCWNVFIDYVLCVYFSSVYGCARSWNLYRFSCCFSFCKPLRELNLVDTGIRMNLSAEESATPERGDLVEIFLPPLGLILGGFLGKRDVSIFQIYAFLKKSVLTIWSPLFPFQLLENKSCLIILLI